MENFFPIYEPVPNQKSEIEFSEDESTGAHSTHHSVSSEPISQNARCSSTLYHGTWPVERTMWNSEPATLGINQPSVHRQMEMPSVMSFASSSGAPMERVLVTPDRSRRSSQQLEAKVDMVYSLLAMLGGQEHADMGETLLALSTNPESCNAMRQSGCIPLLVQLVQSDRDTETRKKASKALHNLVHSQPDEKLKKRETRILKLLETVCAYNEALLNNVEFECDNVSEDGDKHPIQTVAHLMKLSFDEGHRQAICQLGGIHTMAELVEVEHSFHGSTTDEAHCILMRRYACMALTNLTFGDSGNKALLCSYKNFIKVLVVQLQSPSDELRQVTASVLRNLSWRADSSSKEILKEAGCVQGLMKSAMLDNKENTLKSILSALWNLSAHCTENKSEICAVVGALAFLVQMLLYKSSSKSLAIIENSGGIIRNISSQIAVRDDYRAILREHNCLQILLDQLKSPSLTIVSNACGTLWNLSAKNATDQELLWQLGAPSMLRSLNHSKHKMIAMGSSATLKNLLSAKPGQPVLPQMDSTALALDLPVLPTLGVRKQKALLKDLDQNLSETFDNVDTSPCQRKMRNKLQTEMPNNIDSLSRIECTSLDINEPSTSFDHGNTSSLPFLHSGTENLCTSTPEKKKSSDCAEETTTSSELTKSGRKYPRNKFKSGIARKSSADLNHGYRNHDNLSGYVEIGGDQSKEPFTRCSESNQINDSGPDGNDRIKVAQTEGSLNETYSKCSRNLASLELRQDEDGLIDNDKHRIRERTKEIISNMDEKDHCSTEDISDSEVCQSQMNMTESERCLLTINHKTVDETIERNKNVTKGDLISLNIDTDNQPSSETMSSCELPLSTTQVQPSPKPRKYISDERPQPAPRLLSKPSLHRLQLSYIRLIWREIQAAKYSQTGESLEDNTLQKEETSEKQDVGKEKRANLVYENVENLALSASTERVNVDPSSVKNVPSVSKLQPRGFAKNNSGIPTSKFSLRNSSPQNATKPQKDDIQISENSTNTSRVGIPRISNNVSNARRKGKNEAPEVLNMDLNEEYDISLCEAEQTSSTDANCVLNSSELPKSSTQITEVNSFKDANDILEGKIDFKLNQNNTVQQNMSEEDMLGEVNNWYSDIASARREPFETKSRCSNSPCSPEDNLSSSVEKNEYKKSLEKLLDVTHDYSGSAADNCLVFDDKDGERLERSCNDSSNVMDTRMLDPDAMIESLDRFTAELVSQASSHLQNRDSLYKSNMNDNTWDEHSSQNELTFPSISVSAPNVVSFKSDNDTSGSIANHLDTPDGVDHPELQSNEFSSLNTTTMTESTLIAIEANKVADAFREGADMSLSNNSLASLELDHVQPPSQLNSLSNSLICLDSKPNSPRMIRKKSLPSNIMARRALNHSLSHTSSVESLEHPYVAHANNTNNTSSVVTEQMNLGGNTTTQSLTSSDRTFSKRDFIINGTFNENNLSLNNPSSLLFVSPSQLNSLTNIDAINPPSIFNEVTDMCNSLADVGTSEICSEVFEDCFTQIAENTFLTENDATEFSDANSITPIQSDINSSSNENTPKRQKGLSKGLTSKQRRVLAKERYKTYTIAAEMVMKESLMNQEDEENSCSDNFKTACERSRSVDEDATRASPTYNVEQSSQKLSPKERRLSERSRFQTQVIEVSQLQELHRLNSLEQSKGSDSDASGTSSKESPSQSPSRSKLSIRKNCMQRRITNRERFKTQTLDDPKFVHDTLVCDVSSENRESELYLMVEKEANKVLKNLRDATINHEELLDCETLSLVSNEDDSEHNSGGSVNYRTYHKSWGFRRDIPIINPVENVTAASDLAGESCENEPVGSDTEDEAKQACRKPKIVKPVEKKLQDNNNSSEEEQQPKGIRGRRKPLYSKNNINQVSPKSTKPTKTLTSNLVKNVTSTLRSTTPTKSIASKPNKLINKPPLQIKTPNSFSRPNSSSGSPLKSISPSVNVSSGSSNKRNTSKLSSEGKQSSPAHLERQGTFTKDESPTATPKLPVKTKIPGFASRIPSAGTAKSPNSRIPAKTSNIPRSGLFKSASSERSAKTDSVKVYNRSTSADSRESISSRKIQSSLSSHSLKSDLGKVQQNGAIKKTIQNQRSNSNTSLNNTNNSKKQVTSKIASIWKKIEESKKKIPIKNDSKKWIEAQVDSTSDDVDSSSVTSREKDSDVKRISRLGSFIVMDENEDSFKLQ
ncbi:hypothetical protein WA026_005556 [Henosepilachna vigintioctopunctata]|uniref:Adenomatous polyposis coli protein n=1 Tax=Henosepilachna vigintioctopunctata TaxID=420089 RepID=A0AAW1TVD1_9CUCU